ncbi:hypothetical protein FA15DRAFT_616074 [Coprinopsis marcescibilis]|uniref:Uncharacterized protein n=1 Tax=Coprinopsis marcescibilis TaxID=230819 RepID=A0A5C3L016_COPMA|nr:hypothetical protein FA15DRAFT_616074 [Coprinopsis marcescibilis]
MALISSVLPRLPKPRLVLYACVISLACGVLIFSRLGLELNGGILVKDDGSWALNQDSTLGDGLGVGYDDGDIQADSGDDEGFNVGGSAGSKGKGKDGDGDADGAEPRILLVTALYPLAKSKHSDEEYANWLRMFLSRIRSDIYFYSPEGSMQKQVEKAASALPASDDDLKAKINPNSNRNFILNTTYPNVFAVPPLKGLRERYEKMHSIDREKGIHGAELYAVWNAKAFWLDEALKHSKQSFGREYDYAFWIDAGSFRHEHTYSVWPDTGRVKEIFKGVEKQERMFIPISNAPSPVAGRKWKEEFGPFDEDVSEGSFLGGSPNAISWFSHTFYTYHDRYLSMNYFVGKDQTIFNAIMLLFPTRFVTVWNHDPLAPAISQLRTALVHNPATNPQSPFGSVTAKVVSWLKGAAALGNCRDDWYYYHFFLASEREQEAMRDLWEKEERERDGEKGWWWTWAVSEEKAEWWRVNARCRATSRLGFEQVTKRQFGKEWVPPKAGFLNTRRVEEGE